MAAPFPTKGDNFKLVGRLRVPFPQTFGPREKRDVLGEATVVSLQEPPASETAQGSGASGLDLDAATGQGRR